MMASLAAPAVNPDRRPAGPTGRPSVDETSPARMSTYRYARRVLRRNRTFRIASFMRVRVVSFMRLPPDVPCIDSAQPAAT
jgi:hypothetical protein